MIYMGYGILVFGFIRLMVSFVNMVSRIYLPEKYRIDEQPFVSVLIPARNEEKNIGQLLEELLYLNYENYEVLVYNDMSTDNTADIVNAYATKNNKIRLINGKELEKDWLGKNYACHNLAQEAKGDLILFLDADVKTGKDLLSRSVFYMKKYDLELLSIFPKQIMPSWGSRMSVPIMNWILLSLLPLVLIRKSKRPSFSAANGQFMLFDAETYKSMEPHSIFRKNQVEDIAIIKKYKKENLKVATLLGDNDIECKMYDNLDDAIAGFSKNVFQFFGGRAFTTFLFAIVVTIAPVYLFIFNGMIAGFIYLLVIILIRIFISIASKQPVLQNLMLLIPQHFIFWKVIIIALINHKKKNIVWKDRNIYSTS